MDKTSSPTEKPSHWLSLQQWEDSEGFKNIMETEFQSSPLREGETSEDPVARRDFLKLMGASVALTAAAGCMRRPQQKIVPYAKQPEEVVHGVPNFYASSFNDGLETIGLLVRSNEGRPTKVEGNPKFPGTLGGTSARAQAHLLSLYDPERLKAPVKNLLNKERSNRDTISAKFEDIDKQVVAQLKKGGVAVLTGQQNSPSLRSVVGEFAKAFNAKVFAWEPQTYEEIRAAQKSAYNDDGIPYYRFDKAKVIVSVDADFLGTWLAPVHFNRQFASTRVNPKAMSHLVVFDSTYSLTGGNADLRVRIKPSQQLTVLLGLAHDLVVKKNVSSFASYSAVKSALEPYADAAKSLHISPESWEKLVDALAAHRGQSLVVAGGLPTRTAMATEVQIAASFLNSVLGNDGNTVDGKFTLAGSKASDRDLKDLMADLNAGKIKTLIIHGTNPVFTAPKSGFAEALRKADMVISTSDRMDETAAMSHYVLPHGHPMENWGDNESYGGVIAIQQPTIRPLYESRSVYLTLGTWAALGKVGSNRLQKSETAFDYIRSFWKEEVLASYAKGKNFDDFWDEALQVGYIEKTNGGHSPERTFKADTIVSVAKAGTEQKSSSMELVLYPTVMFGDGSLNNVSWLNELPDPVTKIVWDNYASVSIATAEKMGLKEGSIVQLKVGDTEIEIPTHIQPGLHDEVVTVAIGYGRTMAGKLGTGVGRNASVFAKDDKSGIVYSGAAVAVKNTGEMDKLASTQHHHAMDGRDIVKEVSAEDYLKDEKAGNLRPHVFSIWSGHKYNGHKWAMAVDLNTCTGCSACMVACQSENNVPVVGKKYVLQGREMHWIRIDRYYTGDPKSEADHIHSVHQPVMCQHCDNAPCETVCPVAATVHSSEGINDMVYNRCVGTRYCSNNCPYKVRRFNWFNFQKENFDKQPLHLAVNPEVTVRMRGVMEKCTFCNHRIKEEKIRAKVQERELKDGDIKVACEQACPTGAIVFGDVNNAESRVSKLFKSEPRAYGLIEEFNAAPSVRYLTKIRNGHGQHKGESRV